MGGFFFQAFETDDWLFLVLEYCPGQDLFYWLDERQDDSDNLYDVRDSQTSSPFHNDSSTLPPPVTLPLSSRIHTSDSEDDEALRSHTLTSSGESDRTPPSPTLLSSTANASLLSRKRLRLISRMFGQMCEAVQACHQVGIAHRDIKPENFIVVDERGDAGKGGVVVKITDWGLGTREEECEDFDCGSKPYMAYGTFRFLFVEDVGQLLTCFRSFFQNVATTSNRLTIPAKPTSGHLVSYSSTSSTTEIPGPTPPSTIPISSPTFATPADSSKIVSKGSGKKSPGFSLTASFATCWRWRMGN